MNFENNAPDWENQGTEPAEDLKRTGFSAGYKPPASIFNWFWHLISACVTELQNKLNTYSTNTDEALNQKVNNTDYASTSKAGIIKLKKTNHINVSGLTVDENGVTDINTDSEHGTEINADGQVSVKAATEAEIRAKVQEYKPIVPNTLDYAVGESAPEFSAATGRVNIEAGDKLSVILGKIKKFFTDLKTVAFTGNYSDLSGTPTTATQSTAGLMSASDKEKLDGIARGAQVNSVTGIKGSSESTYRTGNVNITKANIGLGDVPNVTTDNQTPTVTTAASRANLTAGDTLKIIISKISKFFADLKTVAFTGNYSDLSGTPTNATQSSAGLMSASDKEKFDGIAQGAQVNSVTGVKGNNESVYRTGDVNITKANVGLGNVPNVSTNDQTPTFSQASSRANIASGEKLSVIFGKIMKFFVDLKSVAFSGSYTDLSDKPTSLKNPSSLSVTKNGTSYIYDSSAAKALGSIYGPESAGTAGYIPVSSGSGAPVWKMPDNYGVCSTASSTLAKTVNISNFKLVTGARVNVKFTYAHSYDSYSTATLNVNSTGAKSIVRFEGALGHEEIRFLRGANIGGDLSCYSPTWRAGETVEFMYDGSYWVMIGSNGGFMNRTPDKIIVGHFNSKGYCDYRCGGTNLNNTSGDWFDCTSTIQGILQGLSYGDEYNGTDPHIIQFCAGTFDFGDTLHFPDTSHGVNIFSRVVILEGQGITETVLRFRASDTYKMYIRGTRVIFKNMTIRIEASSNSEPDQIHLADAAGISFIDCSVHFTASTSSLSHTGAFIKADKVSQDGDGWGYMSYATRQVEFDRTYLSISVAGKACCYSGIQAEKVSITDCVVQLTNSYSGASGGQELNLIYDTDEGIISNSVLIAEGQYNGSTIVNSGKVNISNNTIILKHNRCRIHHYDSSIDTPGGVFAGNTVYCAYYVYLRSSVITGNKFLKLESYQSNTNSSYLYNQCPTVITGNYFDGGTSGSAHGSWTVNCGYKCVIKNNISLGTLSKASNVPTASLFADNLNVAS